MKMYFVAVPQQPNSGLSRLSVDVSRPRTFRHTHGRQNSCEQVKESVAEAATYTIHNKHKGRISVPSAGFEHAIQAIQQLQTYALDGTPIGIGGHDT
jgi:hypothetical protein